MKKFFQNNKGICGIVTAIVITIGSTYCTMAESRIRKVEDSMQVCVKYIIERKAENSFKRKLTNLSNEAIAYSESKTMQHYIREVSPRVHKILLSWRNEGVGQLTLEKMRTIAYGERLEIVEISKRRFPKDIAKIYWTEQSMLGKNFHTEIQEIRLSNSPTKNRIYEAVAVSYCKQSLRLLVKLGNEFLPHDTNGAKSQADAFYE